MACAALTMRLRNTWFNSPTLQTTSAETPAASRSRRCICIRFELRRGRLECMVDVRGCVFGCIGVREFFQGAHDSRTRSTPCSVRSNDLGISVTRKSKSTAPSAVLTSGQPSLWTLQRRFAAMPFDKYSATFACPPADCRNNTLSPMYWIGVLISCAMRPRAARPTRASARGAARSPCARAPASRCRADLAGVVARAPARVAL